MVLLSIIAATTLLSLITVIALEVVDRRNNKVLVEQIETIFSK